MNNENNTNKEVVGNDLVISLSYALTVDGEVYETTEEGKTLDYLHGHGNIVPGLEDALYGLSIGATKEVTISPEDGYGAYDEEALVEVAKDDFPDEIPLEVGVELQVRDEDDDVAVATIAGITKNAVTLDFNHPLAGKTLHFVVTVEGIREPLDEELDHGHVHSEFDELDEYEDETEDF